MKFIHKVMITHAIILIVWACYVINLVLEN